jgi:hypothetical protein
VCDRSNLVRPKGKVSRNGDTYRWLVDDGLLTVTAQHARISGAHSRLRT